MDQLADTHEALVPAQSLRGRSVSTLGQNSTDPLAVVPYQPSAPQRQSSSHSKVPEHHSGPKKQLMVILRPRNAVSKVQKHPKATALKPLPMKLVPSSFPFLPLIEKPSRNRFLMRLARSPNTWNILPSLPATSSPISLCSSIPCQGMSAPLLGASSISTALSLSPDVSNTSIVRTEQEDQAAGATDEDRVNKSHEDQEVPSAGNQSIEELIGGRNCVEAANDSVDETKVQSIEQPTDGQASGEDDTALGSELEIIDAPADNEVPIGADYRDSSQVQPETFDTPANGQASVEAGEEDPLPEQPETINTPTDAHSSVGTKDDEAVEVELETIETPAGGHVSHDAEYHPHPRTNKSIEEEPSSSRVSGDGKTLESRIPRSLASCSDFDKEQDKEASQVAPRSRDEAGVDCTSTEQSQVGLVLDNLPSRLSIAVGTRHIETNKEVGSAGKDITAKQTNSEGVVSASNQATPSPIMRNRAIMRYLKARRLRRLMRSPVAEPPFQRLKNSHAGRAVRLRPKVSKERLRRLRSWGNEQLVADGVVELDGGMTGVEFEEQAEPQVGSGHLLEVQTSQPAGNDSVVNAEGEKVGSEVQVQMRQGFEVGKSTNAVTRRPATIDAGIEVDQIMKDAEFEEEVVDEVMIGSDVEAEMEVDDDMPVLSGDSGVVGGEPMDLRQDGVQSKAEETGNPDPMDTEDQSDRGRVNIERLKDKISRERAELARRETSNNAANSGTMFPGSGGASAQSSRQYVAPLLMSEAGITATSMLYGAAQHLKSTNSATDLRDARWGKRPESRTVQEVASPVLPPGVLRKENGDTSESTESISPPELIPPSMSSPEANTAEDEDSSDMSQSTLAPTSTPASSTSSTPHASPPFRTTTTSEPSSAGSIKGDVAAPRIKTHKRGCDSLDNSSLDEVSGGNLKKANVDLGDQSMLGSRSPKVSPTRRVLLAKTVKRKVQPMPDSGTSESPQPKSVYPAESSKRVQQQRPDDAGANEEIASLNDIPAPMT
ncbi:MAG: hypothetical protein Q9175_004234, partial [Cornicularia normoerica]